MLEKQCGQPCGVPGLRLRPPPWPVVFRKAVLASLVCTAHAERCARAANTTGQGVAPAPLRPTCGSSERRSERRAGCPHERPNFFFEVRDERDQDRNERQDRQEPHVRDALHPARHRRELRARRAAGLRADGLRAAAGSLGAGPAPRAGESAAWDRDAVTSSAREMMRPPGHLTTHAIQGRVCASDWTAVHPAGAYVPQLFYAMDCKSVPPASEAGN